MIIPPAFLSKLTKSFRLLDSCFGLNGTYEDIDGENAAALSAVMRLLREHGFSLTDLAFTSASKKDTGPSFDPDLDYKYRSTLDDLDETRTERDEAMKAADSLRKENKKLRTAAEATGNHMTAMQASINELTAQLNQRDTDLAKTNVRIEELLAANRPKIRMTYKRYTALDKLYQDGELPSDKMVTELRAAGWIDDQYQITAPGLEELTKDPPVQRRSIRTPAPAPEPDSEPMAVPAPPANEELAGIRQQLTDLMAQLNKPQPEELSAIRLQLADVTADRDNAHKAIDELAAILDNIYDLMVEGDRSPLWKQMELRDTLKSWRNDGKWEMIAAWETPKREPEPEAPLQSSWAWDRMRENNAKPYHEQDPVWRRNPFRPPVYNADGVVTELGGPYFDTGWTPDGSMGSGEG